MLDLLFLISLYYDVIMFFLSSIFHTDIQGQDVSYLLVLGILLL